jgi:hypothetical protein
MGVQQSAGSAVEASLPLPESALRIEGVGMCLEGLDSLRVTIRRMTVEMIEGVGMCLEGLDSLRVTIRRMTVEMPHPLGVARER